MVAVEFIILTIIIALLFDFFNGVNDAANSIATIVATRVLRPALAVAWAGFFNFLGPFAGTAVAATVGKGIVLPAFITPELICGALIGAIAWTWICTHYGLPISVSHSLIGGLMGAGIAASGFGALDAPTAAKLAPVLRTMALGAAGGALLGAFSAATTRRRLFVAPVMGAFMGSGFWLSVQIFSGQLEVKGLTATLLFIFYSPMLGFVGGYALNALTMWAFQKANPGKMRRTFGVMQLFSSAFYSYGHGTNDGQKTMGVITALLISAGWVAVPAAGEFPVPTWVKVASALMIALGTLAGGYKVVRTMGMKLTHLRPHQGFAAETSSAVGLFFLGQAGVPVSTTHSITGSILGVGAVGGMRKVRWGVARTIVMAWIFTIPAAAVVGGIVYLLVAALV